MPDLCASCGKNHGWEDGLCTDCMAHQAWESLSPEIQTKIDQLVRDDKYIMAIKTFRENGSPRPGIGSGKYLLYLRSQALGLMSGPPIE